MLDLSQEGQTTPQSLMKTGPTTPQEQAPVPASLVASTFVEQFYRTLGNAPHQLHRFYTQDSVFARLEPGDALSIDAKSKLTVVGQVAIHAKIRELGYKGCKALIDTIDFQDSVDGSVLVLITGYISNDGANPRSFTQSIVLARQERGFYVRNDILRFIQRQDKSGHVPISDVAQPGFVHVVEANKNLSVPVENVVADACSEGSKEIACETMQEAQEPDSSDLLPESVKPLIKFDQTVSESAPIESIAVAELDSTSPVPVKPASWAALFSKSPSSSSPVPAITQPSLQPQSTTSPIPSVHIASESSVKTPDYSCHIFVQNLPDSSTEAEVGSLFAAYGAVDCVDILPKRTMAFVIFENAQGAQAAFKAKTIMLQGRELQVSARKPRNHYSSRGRGRGGRGRHVARGRPHIKQDEFQKN